jgi:hypothetical protein
MTLRTAETGSDKCLDQFPSLGIANYETTKTDDVHVVVFHTLMGGKMFMNQGCVQPIAFTPLTKVYLHVPFSQENLITIMLPSHCTDWLSD